MINFDMEKFVNEVSKKYIIKRFSRGLTGVVKLGFSDEAWLITYENGTVVKCEKTTVDEEADIFVCATDEQWEKMLHVSPPPFYNAYTVASAYHGIKTSSNLMSIQYTPYMSEIIKQMRRFYNDQFEDVDPEPQKPDVRFDAVTGHYVYLTIDGIEYRVYYEESGQGIPFLLQHTAGTDSREYRFLMNDPDFTKDFRFIAYDLPYHGKSLPPFNYPWWNHEYRLELDFILKFMDAFIEALNLDRPAYMGCSMGGHLAPDLAYYRPEKFRAAVGIGAGLSTSQEAVSSEMIDSLGFAHDNPQVSILYEGAANESIVAPYPYTTPNSRREVGWVYSAGGPGVFGGDLYYYYFDHNLTGKAQDIDTSKCMLYLLTGTYDPGTPPQTSQALADQVKGSKLIFMEGVGHYSMLEAYSTFKKYFVDVANEIKTLK